MSTKVSPIEKVRFTKKQYEYLEKMFGEVTTPDITAERLRWNSGVRHVLQHIRRLVHD